MGSESEIKRRIAAIPLTPAVQAAMDAIRRQNGSVYVVGGAIRDWIWRPAEFNPNVIDWDLAANLDGCDLKRLAHAPHPGERFGTFRLAPHVEVTLMRQEKDYDDARHPSTVRPVAAIEADLARRDFTVNAVAYDGRQVVAVPEALSDLAARCLRAVGPPEVRFREDPLRILRLVRLMATTDAEANPATWEAARRLAGETIKVSRERRLNEFIRFLESPQDRWALWGQAGLDEALGWPDSPEERHGRSMNVPRHPAARVAAYGIRQTGNLSELPHWAQTWPVPRSWRDALVRLGEMAPAFEPGAWARRARDPKERQAWIFRDLASASGIPMEELEPPRLALTPEDLKRRWGLRGAGLGRALAFLYEALEEDAEKNQEDLLSSLLEQRLAEFQE